MKKIEIFVSNSEEFYLDSNQRERVMHVLAIQSPRAGLCSLDHQKPTRPYEINNLMMLKKAPHVSRTALTSK